MRNLDIPGKGEIQRNPLGLIYTVFRPMHAANRSSVRKPSLFYVSL